MLVWRKLLKNSQNYEISVNLLQSYNFVIIVWKFYLKTIYFNTLDGKKIVWNWYVIVNMFCVKHCKCSLFCVGRTWHINWISAVRICINVLILYLCKEIVKTILNSQGLKSWSAPFHNMKQTLRVWTIKLQKELHFSSNSLRYAHHSGASLLEPRVFLFILWMEAGHDFSPRLYIFQNIICHFFLRHSCKVEQYSSVTLYIHYCATWHQVTISAIVNAT